MTSFTFLVPDAAAARFDRIAEGQGGRSALLRRLVSAAVDGEGGASMPIVPARTERADQRLELLLTGEEIAAVEALASTKGMKRSAWLVSLVRRRLHRDPEPALPDARSLEGIRSELRRIGVNLNQMTQAVHVKRMDGAGEGVLVDVLSAMQAEVQALVAAVGAARRGDLAYWETPE